MSEADHLDVSIPWDLNKVSEVVTGTKLLFTSSDSQKLDSIRAELTNKIANSGIRVYGFNTGFGDNRNRPTIPTEALGTIQDNIILSHAAGIGQSLESDVVRVALALRIHSLAIGNSGVRGKLISALCQLSNSAVIPIVPGYGSVGASGDLAPLSHLCLPLLGKGEVMTDAGPQNVEVINKSQFGIDFDLSYRPDEEFPNAGAIPSTLGPKEGLALNNGTSFMTAHLAIAALRFENLVKHANLALALSTEAMCGVIDAHQDSIQSLRPHAEVNDCAKAVLSFLSGSQWIVSNGNARQEVRKAREVNGIFDSTQDDYCLRCGPVVHGTALKALNSAKSVLEVEINSVNDNPVIINGDAHSGAHFHGMPLAFSADELRVGMAILGGISERRIAKLMNDKRNYGLPRHLTLGNSDGIKSGWMIAQYSAASLVNELKTRAMPYCVGNVTTGNECEDFVSMGSNSCRAAYELLDVLQDILAIEIAATSRAIMIRQANLPSDCQPSHSAKRVLAAFAKNGVEIGHQEDRPLTEIFSATSHLISTLAFLE